MILQCDQCNTKFRLDDSKIKPGGVKVRCSKCRHVFVAGAEPKQEESDFDAILSGLGAPAAEEKREEAPAQEPPAAATPAPAAPQGEPEPAPEAPAAAKPAAPQPIAGAAAAAAAAAESAAAEVSESALADFSAFEFSAEPAPQAGEPAAAPAEPAAPATPEEQDFNAFDFSSPEEPTISKEAEAATPSQGLDYGEFAFMEEPAAPGETPAAAPGETDFGEFAFSSEPAPAVEEKPAAPEEALDFGEFEFNAEPTVATQKPQAAPDLDFGDFAFEEEPAVQPAAKPAEQPSSKEEFDFGDFSFSEEPPPLKEVPAAEEGAQFGEFEFHEEPQKEEEGGKAPSGDLFALGDLSFAEEKEAPPSSTDLFSSKEEPAPAEFELSGGKGESFGDFSFEKEEAAAPFSFPEQDEEISPAGKEEPFGERQSDDTASTAGLAAAMGAAAIGAGAAAAAAAGKKAAAEHAAPIVAPETPPTTESRMESATPLDFSVGAKPEAMGGLEEGYEEEELPPLSISSRRKGRSVVTVAIIAVAVVVILALTGAGLYLLQSGPAAVQKFDKIGLGFVGKWFGVETPEEGKIEVLRPLASFYQNKEAGELFVVTGDAVNHFKKARASIHVKVTIFDKKGAVLVQKTAYCGNRLTKEQLETLPMAKLDSIMNNQFGDSLSNLSVKPGQSIGFVVAMSSVPKDAADFGVEVVGSTVAGQ